MKRVFFAAAAIMFGLALNAQQNFDDVAKLNTERHDFGKILQGKPVEFFFTLTNKSDKPLVIESAQASCGCTTPEFQKEPIEPGATSKIKVGYNAASNGIFTKNITIKLVGVEQPKVVYITGEQLQQAEYDEYVKQQANKPKNTSSTKAEPVIKTKTKTATTKTKTKAGK